MERGALMGFFSVGVNVRLVNARSQLREINYSDDLGNGGMSRNLEVGKIWSLTAAAALQPATRLPAFSRPAGYFSMS